MTPWRRRAGIRGYLLKSIHWQELVVAIRTVHTDSDQVVLEVTGDSLRDAGSGAGVMALSAREREILGLVGKALSNGQIASRLSLKEATVKRHLRNIFVKPGAVSRIDAVNKAADLDLMPVYPERYQLLVETCRRLGIATPEDPYPVWDGPGGPAVIAPLFLLYDYSFLPLLHPDPFPSREAWCGTTRTGDWHVHLNAATVVYGHLHIPRVTWYDDVRLVEASVGYPREWRRRPPRPGVPRPGAPRQIFPVPASETGSRAQDER